MLCVYALGERGPLDCDESSIKSKALPVVSKMECTFRQQGRHLRAVEMLCLHSGKLSKERERIF